jgi:hypothetical protein
MKKLFMLFGCMAALVLTVQFASAQGKLEGVWRIAEVTTGGENAFKISIADTHRNLVCV